MRSHSPLGAFLSGLLLGPALAPQPRDSCSCLAVQPPAFPQADWGCLCPFPRWMYVEMHVCACWVFLRARAIRLSLICVSLSHVDGALVPHGDGAGSFLQDQPVLA